MQQAAVYSAMQRSQNAQDMQVLQQQHQQLFINYHQLQQVIAQQQLRGQRQRQEPTAGPRRGPVSGSDAAGKSADACGEGREKNSQPMRIPPRSSPSWKSGVDTAKTAGIDHHDRIQ